jgi:branched-chain amino acid transport system substrate-binding protein
MKNILFVAAMLVLFIATSVHAEDITIGVAGPMTGPRTSFGEQMKQAAEIAVEKINADGGILGHKVVLDIEDDANQPQQAVTVANRFLTHDVRYVIGHWGAGMTLPASSVYDAAGVLMITPASILSEITAKSRPLIFRTVGTDKQLADKIAEYLKSTTKPTDKILMITDNSAPATQGISNFLEQDMKQANYTNIVQEFYMAGETDFSTLTTKIKEIKPTSIYCSCYQIEGGLIIRSLRNAGVTQPLIGTDVFNTPEIWQITGATGDGTVFVSDPNFGDSTAAKELVDVLRTQKIQPLPYHYYTYASFQVLKQAMEKSKSLDPKKIAEEIHHDNFDTILGTISYAPNGDLKDTKYQVFVHKNNQTILLSK